MTDGQLTQVLGSLPDELREKLLEEFNEIRRNYSEQRWEPSELKAAKFCELVYRVLEWHTSSSNSYTPLGDHISGFESSVRKFRNQSSFADPIRFHIPNALAFLYRVRNDRGVGHVGGDVDPNHMDAEAVVGGANWVMAELIRIFHNVSVDEAEALVEAVVDRRVPLVWEVGDVRRVLDPNLTHKQTTLVLLYSEYPDPLMDRELSDWCEPARFRDYRSDVLEKCHDERLLEYNRQEGKVWLSPRGVQQVEELLTDLGVELS